MGPSRLVAVLVFSLCFSISTVAQYRERVIYSFGGTPDCGNLAAASLIADADGSLYGTTPFGGTNNDGCVFKLSRRGSGWHETVLHSFGGIDGKGPWAGLVFDKSGNLYGTTETGGTYDGGVAFELSPTADGGWTEIVLHNFGDGDDGVDPASELIFDSDGRLYGTTLWSSGERSGGTVYRLSLGPGGWTETILYAFLYDNPAGGVVLDNGILYGTTIQGGAGNLGAVYELVPSEAGYRERVIYSFNWYDGNQPDSTLVKGPGGRLFGTTAYGGNQAPCVDCGTVFELTRNDAGRWTEKFYALSGVTGAVAVGPVAFDPSGNLYAIANSGYLKDPGGSVFMLRPLDNGPWQATTVHFFNYSPPESYDGSRPNAGVIFDRGRIFGTTSSGGIYNQGTVFEITRLGTAP